MKRLALVRHGETVWHAENRYAGRSDIELTPKGLQQAATLAAWAHSAALDAVWSSSLARAKFTAEPSARELRLPLQIEPRLVELHFGEAEGLTSGEMEARFPERRRAFLADPVANYLPGGEDPVAAVQRGMAGLHAIVKALPLNGRALVIAHNTLIRLLLCHILDVPLSRYRTLFPKLANATLTEFGFADTGTALLAFNAPLTQPTNTPQQKGDSHA